MHLSIGGIEPFTAIDFPGKLAAVAFCRGCGWRCGYCHNPHLLPVAPGDDWSMVETFLDSRRGLLDGIVFSGGEPLLQSGLGEALMRCREMGFATALHTGGNSPTRLERVLPLLDWVGFDVKAPFDTYAAVTGVPGSGDKVQDSLGRLLNSGVDYEVRTTVDPALLDRQQLLALALELRSRGVSHYALQVCRNETPATETDPLTDRELVQQISNLFDTFELRGTLN